MKSRSIGEQQQPRSVIAGSLRVGDNVMLQSILKNFVAKCIVAPVPETKRRLPRAVDVGPRKRGITTNAESVHKINDAAVRPAM